MHNNRTENLTDAKENNGRAAKVLHVEKDSNFLEVSKKILQSFGNFQIDLATSIMEANKALEQKQYDVIICEYCIDGEKGLEFLSELRAKGNNIPFFIFSIDEEIADKAIEMGATKFFSKNGDVEEVFACLANNIKEYYMK